jgi:hypothetical protein
MKLCVSWSQSACGFKCLTSVSFDGAVNRKEALTGDSSCKGAAGGGR